MLTDLIPILDAAVAKVDWHPRIPSGVIEIEYKIAAVIGDELTLDEEILEAVCLGLKPIRSRKLHRGLNLLQAGYPYRLSVKQNDRTGMAEIPPSEVLIENILTFYPIDLEFVHYIRSSIRAINTIIQGEPGGGLVVDLPSPFWNLHKLRLARRSILLGLAGQWDEDHCDEPILWQSQKKITMIAKAGSEISLAETVNRLIWLGMKNSAEQKKDTLLDFLVRANEEKNKFLIDNMVLSRRTYDTLVESGWRPDRLELENLPRTIEFFLDFLQKNGYKQEKDVGEELLISLDDALKRYRYSGTPYSDSFDTKKVGVLVPGWFYMGELIIQPKVREIN